jgi:hypothetical protein
VIKSDSEGKAQKIILNFYHIHYRLVYNIRDISTDPDNERARDQREKELLKQHQYVNEYGQDILGNTEVEIEINNRAGLSPNRRSHINPINTENLNSSVESDRPHQDTNVPQNLVTTFANVNNELRLNRLQFNTENTESLYMDPVSDSVAAPNVMFDRFTGDRDNGLNSTQLLNSSHQHLLNQTLDKKQSYPNVSQPVTV